MKAFSPLLAACSLACASGAPGAVIVVNTTNSLDPVVGLETGLAQAITQLQDGDFIHFNIPVPPGGSDVHYLPTPPGGYPKITKANVTLDGYTQPGAIANTNTILGSNTAWIKIVLDSRNGYFRDMTYDPANPAAGYSAADGAILGLHNASNVTLRGLCFLAITAGADTTNRLGAPFDETHAIAIGRDLGGTSEGAHISGCWLGVDVDGAGVFAGEIGISAFRHRDDVVGNSARVGCAGVVIGVKPGSSNPRAEFNVIVGHHENIIMEGQRQRVSGNFLGVMPDGMRDYIPSFAQPGRLGEAHIEIGRGGSGVVIGTDGDGVNDAEERNVLGGVVTDGAQGSFNMGGYTHMIEFFSLNNSPGPDRVGIRIAGNYFAVAIDGVTRFTNGVPAINGGGAAGSQYWIGSDFDGVSDSLEANLIYNNYPEGLFYETPYTNSTGTGVGSHGFFDQANGGTLYAVRGNVLVNNYPFPVNPGMTGNVFRPYVNKALLTPRTSNAELYPTISAASSTARISGTVPAANATYPWTFIDLYVPDAEGLINGLVAPDPNLPHGWVQGARYLGTFVLGSAQDRDPSVEGYAFDLCGLGLAPGTLVTVAANYSKDPPGTHNARACTSLFSAPASLPAGIAITSMNRAGTSMTLHWCGGSGPYQMQKKLRLDDPEWTNVGIPTANFYSTDSETGPASFYRVVGN